MGKMVAVKGISSSAQEVSEVRSSCTDRGQSRIEAPRSGKGLGRVLGTALAAIVAAAPMAGAPDAHAEGPVHGTLVEDPLVGQLRDLRGAVDRYAAAEQQKTHREVAELGRQAEATSHSLSVNANEAFRLLTKKR
jgi:hypothetical protein